MSKLSFSTWLFLKYMDYKAVHQAKGHPYLSFEMWRVKMSVEVL